MREKKETASPSPLSSAASTAVMAMSSLPSLAEAEVSPISITPTYIDVAELDIGWSIRCFYGGISERDHEVTDKESGEIEIKRLKSALLIAEDPDSPEGERNMLTYESASAVLVSTLEEKSKAGLVEAHRSGLLVKFLGLKKNQNNSHKSARWDVRILNFR